MSGHVGGTPAGSGSGDAGLIDSVPEHLLDHHPRLFEGVILMTLCLIALPLLWSLLAEALRPRRRRAVRSSDLSEEEEDVVAEEELYAPTPASAGQYTDDDFDMLPPPSASQLAAAARQQQPTMPPPRTRLSDTQHVPASLFSISPSAGSEDSLDDEHYATPMQVKTSGADAGRDRCTPALPLSCCAPPRSCYCSQR